MLPKNLMSVHWLVCDDKKPPIDDIPEASKDQVGNRQVRIGWLRVGYGLLRFGYGMVTGWSLGSYRVVMGWSGVVTG